MPDFIIRDGRPGKSAYQLAIDSGAIPPETTLAQWLADQQGPPGNDGSPDTPEQIVAKIAQATDANLLSDSQLAGLAGQNNVAHLAVDVAIGDTVTIEWWELESGATGVVDWGDGSATETVALTTDAAVTSHTYAAAYNGPVTIALNGTDHIRIIRVVGRWKFDVAEIGVPVYRLSLKTGNLCFGDVGRIGGLTWLQAIEDNELYTSGDLPEVTYWGITGSNRIVLQGERLGPDVSHVDVKGFGKVLGTIPELLNCAQFGISSQVSETIVPLDNIPNINQLYLGVKVVPKGSLDSLTSINNILWIINREYEEPITGSIDNQTASSSIQIWGPNTISGSIENLTASRVDIRGENTIDIRPVPANVNTCSHWRFANKTAAECDSFLIMLAENSNRTSGQIVLPNRSVSSDAAVTTLVANGWDSPTIFGGVDPVEAIPSGYEIAFGDDFNSVDAIHDTTAALLEIEFSLTVKSSDRRIICGSGIIRPYLFMVDSGALKFQHKRTSTNSGSATVTVGTATVGQTIHRKLSVTATTWELRDTCTDSILGSGSLDFNFAFGTNILNIGNYSAGNEQLAPNLLHSLRVAYDGVDRVRINSPSYDNEVAANPLTRASDPAIVVDRFASKCPI